MPRDCNVEGHVLVDDDALCECLVCGEALQISDRIAVHVVRPHDELDCADSVASFDEWGHTGTGTDPEGKR